MKLKDFESLQNGQKVLHKHYGVCDVIDYTPMFGPHLVPESKTGKELLKIHSGVDYPLLETSNRLIKAIS